MKIDIARKLKIGPVEFFGALKSWPINRLRPKAEWYDGNEFMLVLEFGNGNSDPVWVVELTLTLPLCLVEQLRGPISDEPPSFMERRG